MICANPKCGKEFQSQNTRKKCCCKDCNQYYQKNKRRILSGTYQEFYFIKCKNCGTDFKTHLESKQYCSKDCKQAVLRRRWALEHPEKIEEIKRRKNEKARQETIIKRGYFIPLEKVCAECGNSFKCSIHNPYKMYCSIKCRKKVEYRRHKDGYIKKAYNKKRLFIHMTNQEKTRLCQCGKQFMIRKNTFNQKFCSIKCRNKFLGRITRANNLETIRENARRWAAKDKELLGDNYVRQKLIRSAKKIGMNRNDLPNELIELKRTQIKLKRKMYGKGTNNTQESVRTSS